MSVQLHVTHRDEYWSGREDGRRDALADAGYRPGAGDTDGQRAYGLGYEDGWAATYPCSNGTCDHLAHR